MLKMMEVRLLNILFIFIYFLFYFMGRRIPMHCPLDFKSNMIKVRLLNIFTFFF